MKLSVSLDFGVGARQEMGILSDNGRDTLFRFSPTFLAAGLNPSPFRLPVRAAPTVYDFTGRMDTFGLFEDSLPDGWGRRIVDQTFRRMQGRTPTVLERLACVGANGMGALVYEPALLDDDVSAEFDLARMAEEAMSFDAGETQTVLPALRQAAGSSGGARPKAFIAYNPETGEVGPERLNLLSGFEHWLVKFNTRAEGSHSGETEYRYYEAAIRAGADMSLSRLLKTSAGSFFATRRFDRGSDGTRLHMATAAGLLHADFRVPGDEYETLFKLADALTRDYATKCELFRRAALNVLGHNRDDHLKNFAFLMDRSGRWKLAPFYDFTYAEGPNGWQTLSVAGEGMRPGKDDLMRLARVVGMKNADADAIVEQVSFSVTQLNTDNKG